MVSKALKKLHENRQQGSQPKLEVPKPRRTQFEIDSQERQMAVEEGRYRTQEINRMNTPSRQRARPLYTEDAPKIKERYNPYSV